MAQFNCPICNEGFDQKSRFDRHMMTSHPEQAPSAADLEQALKGIEYPGKLEDLIRHAEERAGDEITELLNQLPDREYRDAAEVSRALGELKSKQPKPSHQPSRKGGREAMNSASAASVAQAFEGIDFPKSKEDLEAHAKDRASDEIMEIISRFASKTYRDMSDIAKEAGAVASRDSSR